MVDYESYLAKKITFDEFIEGVEFADLAQLTNEMVDVMLARIAGCSDADVVFHPVDPAANDPYASDDAEIGMSWTLGHVIVHTTASAEEAAALASELARGVEVSGRSRSEVPWQDVTTIQQCRQRLEESRRMRLASLEMWPDKPYLENRYRPWPTAPNVNAIGRFILGLRHDADHLGQIANVVEQAANARTT